MSDISRLWPRCRQNLIVLLFSLTMLAPPALSQTDTAAHDVLSTPDLVRLERTFTHLADKVRPSVVAIRTFREFSRAGGRTMSMPHSQGSGFVYRSNGLIATNHHVIEGAARIEVVLFNGDVYPAEIVEFDPRSDLAIIRIPVQDLRVAPLADLSEVRQGQFAFTVGNPFGLANDDGHTAFSFGVVSALGKSLVGRIDTGGLDRHYSNLIQTSASINPGNSGGPLFDIQGQVIGVATAMYSSSGVDEGVGFAVPMSARTRHILETLSEGHLVRYGYLGVLVQDFNPREHGDLGVPGRHGALVQGLAAMTPPGPAQRAGLRPGDVITEFDGVPVSNRDHLIRLVGATPVGAEVDVVYYRDRRPNHIKVMLDERAETAAAHNRSDAQSEPVLFMSWRGVTLVEPTASFLLSHGFSRESPGLFVADVPRDSQPYRNGLRERTMIIRVNGERVRTREDFTAAVKQAGDKLRLELLDNSIVVLPN